MSFCASHCWAAQRTVLWTARCGPRPFNVACAFRRSGAAKRRPRRTRYFPATNIEGARSTPEGRPLQKGRAHVSPVQRPSLDLPTMPLSTWPASPECPAHPFVRHASVWVACLPSVVAVAICCTHPPPVYNVSSQTISRPWRQPWQSFVRTPPALHNAWF